MDSKVFNIETIDPIEIFGVNNKRLEALAGEFPKLSIVGRGNEIKVSGEESEIVRFRKKFKLLLENYREFNFISDDAFNHIVKGRYENVMSEADKDVILYGVNGKPVRALTHNQKKLEQLYPKNDIIFAVGPAGTGKTYTAIALAVRALKNREVRRIILCRPAVEAGESLGFLPGDLLEKITPYLQPLYDALADMIPKGRLKEYLDDDVIQISPLAYMRGRTLSDAVVILDEAQNATNKQLKMFLTRMGKNSHMIVTGDITQIDLPRRSDSGLVSAVNILKEIKGIETIMFDKEDVVRHRLVKDIIEAYEKEELKK